MRKLPLLAALLCSLASVQAAEPLVAPAAQHPLTGSWTWTLPGKTCTESLNYQGNGTRQGSSGEEVTQSRYEVSPMPSLLGFYRLTHFERQASGFTPGSSETPDDKIVSGAKTTPNFSAIRHSESSTEISGNSPSLMGVRKVGVLLNESAQADAAGHGRPAEGIPTIHGGEDVKETVTEGNGKKDCSGDLHEAPGEPVTRFIQFSPKKDQLIVCREESLKACFGPLKRAPQ